MFENNNERKLSSNLEELLDELFRNNSEECRSNFENKKSSIYGRKSGYNDIQQIPFEELNRLGYLMHCYNGSNSDTQKCSNENSTLRDLSEKLEYSLENIDRYLFKNKYNSTFSKIDSNNGYIQELDDFKLNCVSSITIRLLDSIYSLLLIESTEKIPKLNEKNGDNFDNILLLFDEMNNMKAIGEIIHRYTKKIESIMDSKQPSYVKIHVQHIAINDCTNIFKYLSERILK